MRRIAGLENLVVTIGNRRVPRPPVAVPPGRLFHQGPAAVRAGGAAHRAELDEVRRIAGLENLVVTTGNRRVTRPPVAVPLERVFQRGPAAAADDAAHRAELDEVRLVAGLQNLVVTIGPSRPQLLTTLVKGADEHVDRLRRARGEPAGAASPLPAAPAPDARRVGSMDEQPRQDELAEAAEVRGLRAGLFCLACPPALPACLPACLCVCVCVCVCVRVCTCMCMCMCMCMCGAGCGARARGSCGPGGGSRARRACVRSHSGSSD